MRKTRRSKSSGTFIILLIATFAVSVGASYFLMKGKFSFESAFIDEIESRQADTARKEQKKDTSGLYERQESGVSSPLPAAEDAVRKYLRDYKVRLLDLYMDNAGVVYVDMGDELKKNFRGDASEELRTFAGLYRSIEAVVPGFTALKVLMEGHETETIGGHIDISKPLGKEIAEDI
ncbi:MAG: hypothetical protein HZA16_14030 [Nitrospirae bacterium]|nr:hypothetical protein [Nitrospirota bacterium]